MEAKGAGFLKVTGIIMIIGASLGIIISILALIGTAAISAMGNTLEITEAVDYNIGLLYVSGILSLVGAAMEMVAGILGVANSKKPEKANVCIVFGVIVILFSLAGSILTVVGGNSFPVVSFLIGLVLPVLYLIGAFKNKA
ncbi:MAG: hypothetical protein PUA84_05325 [Oscillospiraceae bacterium]|nr:hypothetical protein [Oscillospiraceae bacterium]